MMKRITLLLVLFVWAGIALAQTKLWEKSSAGGNFPTYLGTGNLERGITTSTVVLNPFTKVWEKSSGATTFPTYLGTGNLERGIAYGSSSGNDRMYLVSRTGGSKIYVLNSATGDSVKMLDTAGFSAIASGTYLLNDVET
ncbi:MAG: hypothetical protein NTV54_09665, partial [Ignavibacteriales bacterium]|nr:hypothetical protein [Ignavibacteriales bacterium]